MIELKNLSFRYEGADEGIHDINLSIHTGELVVLTGESGCGKTTLTRVLSGLCPQFYAGVLEGTYLLNGKDATTLDIDEIGVQVGNVFQDPRSQFFTTNTTDEIVFAMENRDCSRSLMEERLQEISQLVGISELLDRNILGLSSGEKQKVAIAAACAMYPKVLIMDEPSANLDMEGTQRIAELLAELKKRGFTIIISEHRLYYLYSLLDKMVIMQEGSLKYIYSRADVRQLPADNLQKLGLRTLYQNKVRTNHMTSGGMPVLEVRDVTFYRKERNILNHVSLSLYGGQITALTGLNGAGKTTLCKIIVGLLKEHSGSVLFQGKPMNRKKRLQSSFFVGQDVDYQLYTSSVMEEVVLNQKKSASLQEKAEDILNKLGLLSVKNRHPASLSGGQKQRVLLAAALLRERQILVLDEPTSGLDGKHMRIMAALLRKAASSEMCVLVITHDMEFVELAADRVERLER